MFFDNMLTETDQNSDSVLFHEDLILFCLISQRSDLILISVSCQVRIRSSHSELVSSHSDFMSEQNEIRIRYSHADQNIKTSVKINQKISQNADKNNQNIS